MSATPPHSGSHLEYHFAYCQPCDCYTYLMRGSSGKNKACHRRGILIGIKCCRCKRKRAIAGSFLTQPTNGNLHEA